MKLHLGCGENYLSGYVNIDFPKQYHSVQQKRVADIYADILALKYPRESVEEIRLHHVFEHFQRPIASALLVSWREWLIPGGLLRLEVPDFTGTAAIAINPKSSERARNVALRHIFGSQEAPWAVHYEGWSKKTLEDLLERYQYEVTEVAEHKYKGTCNIEIRAQKRNKVIRRIQARSLTKDYLSTHLIDSSPTENRLLSVWMRMYDDQIKKSWPR